jgi:hypothetical protein
MPSTGGGVTSDADEEPAVGDHLTPTTDTHSAGVYRVVGHGDGTVTLLRVGDADGHRVHTGEIVSVPATTDGFEQTAAPRRPPLTAVLTGPFRDAAWSLRAFLVSLRRRPRQTTLAAVPLAVAVAVDGVAPGSVVGGLVVLGGSGLAAVGSGRLDRHGE